MPGQVDQSQCCQVYLVHAYQQGFPGGAAAAGLPQPVLVAALDDYLAQEEAASGTVSVHLAGGYAWPLDWKAGEEVQDARICLELEKPARHHTCQQQHVAAIPGLESLQTL